MNIGIYKITNPKGRIYIGQSIDIKRRFKEYKILSSSKKQCKLHNSFNKYGISSHSFSVIEYCDISELNSKERYYQELFNCIGSYGLNLKLQSTDELKEVPSIETKNKISESMKQKHQDPEYKLKMIFSRKGVPKSEETKLKLREKTGRDFGNLKIGVCGEFSPRSKKVIDLKTSIIYFSAKEASIRLNIGYTALKNNLNGKTKIQKFKYL